MTVSATVIADCQVQVRMDDEGSRKMLEMMDICQNDIPPVFDICDSDGSGDVSYTELVG